MRRLAGELAFFVVDTVWSCAAAVKLNDTEAMVRYLGRLAELCVEARVTGIVINHLSLNNESLGRRAAALVRGIVRLQRADPDDRTLLRLEADGNIMPGAPLGVRLGDGSHTYSREAPTVRQPARPGRPPDQCEAAKDTIRAVLGKRNGQATSDVIRAVVATGVSETHVLEGPQGPDRGRRTGHRGRATCTHAPAGNRHFHKSGGGENPPF